MATRRMRSFFNVGGGNRGRSEDVLDWTKQDEKLMQAVKRGNMDRVQIQLKKGGDPSKIDPSQGLTAFHQAAADGKLDIVNLMFSVGIDINVRDSRGQTALHYAIQNGHTDVTMALLQDHADVSLNNSTHQPMLHLACDSCRMDIVRLLLDQKAPVTDKDQNGLTALSYAACRGQAAICRLLLQYGADINDQDINGNTALIHAVKNNQAAVCAYLIDQGADVTITDNDGRSALWHAVNLDLAGIRKLLERYQQQNRLSSGMPREYSVDRSSTSVEGIPAESVQYIQVLSTSQSQGQPGRSSQWSLYEVINDQSLRDSFDSQVNTTPSAVEPRRSYTEVPIYSEIQHSLSSDVSPGRRIEHNQFEMYMDSYESENLSEILDQTLTNLKSTPVAYDSTDSLPPGAPSEPTSHVERQEVSNIVTNFDLSSTNKRQSSYVFSEKQDLIKKIEEQNAVLNEQLRLLDSVNKAHSWIGKEVASCCITAKMLKRQSIETDDESSENSPTEDLENRLNKLVEVIGTRDEEADVDEYENGTADSLADVLLKLTEDNLQLQYQNKLLSDCLMPVEIRLSQTQVIVQELERTKDLKKKLQSDLSELEQKNFELSKAIKHAEMAARVSSDEKDELLAEIEKLKLEVSHHTFSPRSTTLQNMQKVEASLRCYVEELLIQGQKDTVYGQNGYEISSIPVFSGTEAEVSDKQANKQSNSRDKALTERALRFEVEELLIQSSSFKGESQLEAIKPVSNFNVKTSDTHDELLQGLSEELDKVNDKLLQYKCRLQVAERTERALRNDMEEMIMHDNPFTTDVTSVSLLTSHVKSNNSNSGTDQQSYDALLQQYESLQEHVRSYSKLAEKVERSLRDDVERTLLSLENESSKDQVQKHCLSDQSNNEMVARMQVQQKLMSKVELALRAETEENLIASAKHRFVEAAEDRYCDVPQLFIAAEPIKSQSTTLSRSTFDLLQSKVQRELRDELEKLLIQGEVSQPHYITNTENTIENLKRALHTCLMKHKQMTRTETALRKEIEDALVLKQSVIDEVPRRVELSLSSENRSASVDQTPSVANEEIETLKRALKRMSLVESALRREVEDALVLKQSVIDEVPRRVELSLSSENRSASVDQTPSVANEEIETLKRALKRTALVESALRREVEDWCLLRETELLEKRSRLTRLTDVAKLSLDLGRDDEALKPVAVSSEMTYHKTEAALRTELEELLLGVCKDREVLVNLPEKPLQSSKSVSISWSGYQLSEFALRAEIEDSSVQIGNLESELKQVSLTLLGQQDSMSAQQRVVDECKMLNDDLSRKLFRAEEQLLELKAQLEDTKPYKQLVVERDQEIVSLSNKLRDLASRFDEQAVEFQNAIKQAKRAGGSSAEIAEMSAEIESLKAKLEQAQSFPVIVPTDETTSKSYQPETCVREEASVEMATNPGLISMEDSSDDEKISVSETQSAWNQHQADFSTHTAVKMSTERSLRQEIEDLLLLRFDVPHENVLSALSEQEADLQRRLTNAQKCELSLRAEIEELIQVPSNLISVKENSECDQKQQDFRDSKQAALKSGLIERALRFELEESLMNRSARSRREGIKQLTIQIIPPLSIDAASFSNDALNQEIQLLTAQLKDKDAQLAEEKTRFSAEIENLKKELATSQGSRRLSGFEKSNDMMVAQMEIQISLLLDRVKDYENLKEDNETLKMENRRLKAEIEKERLKRTLSRDSSSDDDAIIVSEVVVDCKSGKPDVNQQTDISTDETDAVVLRRNDVNLVSSSNTNSSDFQKQLKTIETLQRENEMLRDELAALTEELEKQKSITSSMLTPIGAQDDILTVQISALHSKVKKLNEENMRLAEKAEMERKELMNEIQSQQSELKQQALLKSKLEYDLKLKEDEAACEIEALMDENAALKKKLRDTQTLSRNEHDEFLEERERLISSIAEFKVENCRLLENVSSSEQKVRELTGLLEILQQQYSPLLNRQRDSSIETALRTEIEALLMARNELERPVAGFKQLEAEAPRDDLLGSGKDLTWSITKISPTQQTERQSSVVVGNHDDVILRHRRVEKELRTMYEDLLIQKTGDLPVALEQANETGQIPLGNTSNFESIVFDLERQISQLKTDNDELQKSCIVCKQELQSMANVELELRKQVEEQIMKPDTVDVTVTELNVSSPEQIRRLEKNEKYHCVTEKALRSEIEELLIVRPLHVTETVVAEVQGYGEVHAVREAQQRMEKSLRPNEEKPDALFSKDESEIDGKYGAVQPLNSDSNKNNVGDSCENVLDDEIQDLTFKNQVLKHENEYLRREIEKLKVNSCNFTGREQELRREIEELLISTENHWDNFEEQNDDRAFRNDLGTPSNLAVRELSKMRAIESSLRDEIEQLRTQIQVSVPATEVIQELEQPLNASNLGCGRQETTNPTSDNSCRSCDELMKRYSSLEIALADLTKEKEALESSRGPLTDFNADLKSKNAAAGAIQPSTDNDYVVHLEREVSLLKETNRALANDVSQLQYCLSQQQTALEGLVEVDIGNEQEYMHRKLKQFSVAATKHASEMAEMEERQRVMKQQLKQLQVDNSRIMEENETLRELAQLRSMPPKELVARLRTENAKLHEFVQLLEQRLERKVSPIVTTTQQTPTHTREARSPHSQMHLSLLSTEAPENASSSSYSEKVMANTVEECHEEIDRLRRLYQETDKRYRDVVATYRAHLLAMAQGRVDYEVRDALQRIVRLRDGDEDSATFT